MQCPHCGSSTVRRSRRRGLRDRVASWLSRWPYRCESCYFRFWADRRQPHPSRPAWHPQPVRAAVARIEVHATSPAQLDEMLLSLNQALSRFQPGVQTSRPTELVR
jgi:transposase-like protein